MLDTRLLEEASEILFGDRQWHEDYPDIIDDADVCYVHPTDGRRVSYPQLVSELAKVK